MVQIYKAVENSSEKATYFIREIVGKYYSDGILVYRTSSGVNYERIGKPNLWLDNPNLWCCIGHADSVASMLMATLKQMEVENGKE